MGDNKEITLRDRGDMTPEQLLSQAIEKGVPVETMERLMEMAEKWKANRAREAYYQALSDFQAECPVIHKTKTVLDKKNDKVRYRYAPLESIVQQVAELLNKHGFSYTLKPETNGDHVKAVCVVHHVDGHSDQSEFGVPIDLESYMNQQQRFASALTYAKRYAFCAAFGIMTGDEDDDANSASDVTNGSTQSGADLGNPRKTSQPGATPMKSDKYVNLETEMFQLLNKLPSETVTLNGQEMDLHKYKNDTARNLNTRVFKIKDMEQAIEALKDLVDEVQMLQPEETEEELSD